MNLRSLLFCLFLLFGTAALAHAELRSSSVEDGATVTEPLTQVTLTFTEAAELGFSTFKVYPLDADLGERDVQRLNGLAGALVGEVLTAPGDEAARADTGVTTAERTSAAVEVALKDDLEPGHYVVEKAFVEK